GAGGPGGLPGGGQGPRRGAVGGVGRPRPRRGSFRRGPGGGPPGGRPPPEGPGGCRGRRRPPAGPRRGRPGPRPRRTPPGRTPAGGPDRGCPGRRGRSPRCRAVTRSWAPPRPGSGARWNTMRETGGGTVTFFCGRSGPAAGQAVDRHPEPAAGVGPVLLGGGEGDAEGGGRLLGGEAGEEAELDQRGLARALRLELAEGLVQGEQAVAVPLLQGRLEVVEVEPAPPAPGLAGLLVAGTVDQDAAHGLGGGGEEMPA